jgi:hypothetical protein
MATAIKTDPGMDYHSGSGEYMFNFFHALLMLSPATHAGSSPSSPAQASLRPPSLSLS